MVHVRSVNLLVDQKITISFWNSKKKRLWLSFVLPDILTLGFLPKFGMLRIVYKILCSDVFGKHVVGRSFSKLWFSFFVSSPANHYFLINFRNSYFSNCFWRVMIFWFVGTICDCLLCFIINFWRSQQIVIFEHVWELMVSEFWSIEIFRLSETMTIFALSENYNIQANWTSLFWDLFGTSWFPFSLEARGFGLLPDCLNCRGTSCSPNLWEIIISRLFGKLPKSSKSWPLFR